MLVSVPRISICLTDLHKLVMVGLHLWEGHELSCNKCNSARGHTVNNLDTLDSTLILSAALCDLGNQPQDIPNSNMVCKTFHLCGHKGLQSRLSLPWWWCFCRWCFGLFLVVLQATFTCGKSTECVVENPLKRTVLSQHCTQNSAVKLRTLSLGSRKPNPSLPLNALGGM